MNYEQKKRASVVRLLPNLSIADRCRVEQAARAFDNHPDRKIEEAAYVAKWDAEIRAAVEAGRAAASDG